MRILLAEKIISPGVFTDEIDQTFLPAAIQDIGAALVGPTVKGPSLIPTTITSYYLHKRDQGSDGWSSLVTPLIIANSGQTLTAQTTEGVIEGLFTEWIRETASESADGYKIVYSVATSGGNTRGTAMVDSKLNGSGNYQTLLVDTNDYSSQEFPNGSAATVTTYNLRITKG